MTDDPRPAGYAISYRRRGERQRKTAYIWADSEEAALAQFRRISRGAYAVMPLREAERDEAEARRRKP